MGTIFCLPHDEKMTTSAAAAAVHVPEEIVFKILSGLPVKSLLRFSCVCKSWWVTINKNPWFISQHLRQSTLNANGGNLLVRSRPLRGYKKIMHLVKLNFDHVNRGTSFIYFDDHLCTPLNIPSSLEDVFGGAHICSINGLVFFHNRFSYRGYAVWNPATGRFKNIPLERKLNDGHCHRRLVGFGVAPGDLDYKLASIQISKQSVNAKGTDIVLIQVYSSLSGLWREIDAAKTFPTDYDIRIREEDFPKPFWWNALGILAKGVLYWILDQKIIVGFNICDEVFFQLTMPDFHGINVDVEKGYRLAEIKGSLALFPNCSNVHRFLYAREMNERVEAWTKRLSSGPPVYKHILGHWKSYLFTVGSVTKQISSFQGGERCLILGAYNYVESLVPVG